jgi:GTP-binding protein
MSFVDKVSITVSAGEGGDGKLSFHREKFISKGGPDGGDGGDGGDIVLQASRNQNTLSALRYQKAVLAESGRPGGKSRKHGRSAKDYIIGVPVGTVAIATDNKRLLADLVEDGQTAVIANGGKGGFGNAHFVSSRRQAPNFAEKGEPGESLELELELKMIADVSLVGLPNAGKSTLLSKLSNARPEIANYPFTTLTPNLGVVDIDGSTSILFADIPGLIEGAAEGKGLGHDFLRHIERTAVIVHLIDAYQKDVAKAYKTIRSELKVYSPELVKRPEIIAINKTEGLDKEIIDDLIAQITSTASKDSQVIAISAQAGNGISQLLYSVNQEVQSVRNQKTEETKTVDLPVLRLKDISDAWDIVKKENEFIVSGPKIERFAKRTNFDNEQAVQRLRDIMRRDGILHELIRQGIEAGQIIRIGDYGKLEY